MLLARALVCVRAFVIRPRVHISLYRRRNADRHQTGAVSNVLTAPTTSLCQSDLSAELRAVQDLVNSQ